MASEYFGSGAFDATMRQPPPLPVPRTMKGIRKEANRQRKEHRGKMKEARGRIKALNQQIRGAGFGRRLSNERKKDIRQEMRAMRKKAKFDRNVHKQFGTWQKHNIKLLRTRNAQLKQQARAYKKAQRAAKPRAKAKAQQRKFRTARKAHDLLYLARLAQRAFKKKNVGDGRNHGFKPRRRKR